MEPCSQGQGKLEGEQLDVGPAPYQLTDAWPGLWGLSEPAARSAPVTISIWQESSLGPAQSGPRGREQLRAEDKSPNQAEAVSGDSKGEGRQQ